MGTGNNVYPVVGDWNGDGIDSIGLYDRSTGQLQLRDTNAAGAPDYTLTLGIANDLPLAGRWVSRMAGSGVGVFRPSNGLISACVSCRSCF
jgi:endoglucanase